MKLKLNNLVSLFILFYTFNMYFFKIDNQGPAGVGIPSERATPCRTNASRLRHRGRESVRITSPFEGPVDEAQPGRSHRIRLQHRWGRTWDACFWDGKTLYRYIAFLLYFFFSFSQNHLFCKMCCQSFLKKTWLHLFSSILAEAIHHRFTEPTWKRNET